MKLAIAIFAKTPLPGAVKTRLSPQLDGRESAELYRCMLLDTVARVSRLPWDVAVFYDGDRAFFEEAFPGVRLEPQAEGGLGERLTAAVRRLADLGYDGCLVVGSDAPDVPVEYVEEGGRLLCGGTDVVFGPADDGGYYLVGVKGGESAVFSNVPWSTSAVLEKSLERAREAALTVGLLPAWYDLDTFEDLLRPSLQDLDNGADHTRAFLGKLGIGLGRPTSGACVSP